MSAQKQLEVVQVPMEADEARALTDQIKTTVEFAWGLIVQAYLGQAWLALGYETWDSYCAKEFDGANLQLPREKRREAVRSLKDHKLSTRAIGAATGVTHTTVERDLVEMAQNVPVNAEVDEDGLTEELIESEPELATVIGIDGKKYQSKPKRKVTPPKPPPPVHNMINRDVKALVDEISQLTRTAKNVVTQAKRLQRKNDRFSDTHGQQIASAAAGLSDAAALLIEIGEKK